MMSICDCVVRMKAITWRTCTAVHAAASAECLLVWVPCRLPVAMQEVQQLTQPSALTQCARGMMNGASADASCSALQ
jgi:hypothetical protein